MTRSHEFVDAEDPRVASALVQMVEFVTAHGGVIRPGTQLIEREHNLAVTCEPSAAPAGTLLFRVPRDLLVPVTDVVWSRRQDALEMAGPPPDLAPAQLTLLELFIELYNACDKVPVTAATHPAAAPLPVTLVETVRAVYPDFRREARSASQVLIGCRVFGMRPAASQDDGPDMGRIQVLLPLIDSLDHDAAGAPFELDDAALSTHLAQPQGGQTCFARYGGRRDSLGQALHYGYVDTATPFAVGAPLSVDVVGVGRVTVDRRGGHRRHRLDPPMLSRDQDGTVHVSHAVFDCEHPDRLTGVLELAGRSVAAQAGAGPDAAKAAGRNLLRAIAVENLTLLDRIAREAEAVNSQAVTMVANAARAQAAVIRRFLRAAELS